MLTPRTRAAGSPSPRALVAALLAAVSLAAGTACAVPSHARFVPEAHLTHSGIDAIAAVAAPAAPPAAEPAPLPGVDVEPSPAGWQPPVAERRPYPRRVEQWRGLVREVLAEEWENGTLAGHAARIDDDLVLAVMEQESGGNPRARSWAGAMGLMQVMDFTFALMMAGSESLAPQIDPAAFWDERSNVRAGIRYLALAMQYQEGDIYWSLASYNAGIGNARSWRRAGLYAVPPIGGFVETANYAPRIMRSYMRHRPDVLLYVPDVMPEEHIPGALELLRSFRRRGA